VVPRSAGIAHYDLDELMAEYLGVPWPSEATPADHDRALKRLRCDFAVEPVPGKRIALWALLYQLGESPTLDVAFADPADRTTARALMELLQVADHAGGSKL